MVVFRIPPRPPQFHAKHTHVDDSIRFGKATSKKELGLLGSGLVFFLRLEAGADGELKMPTHHSDTATQKKS